MGPKHLLSLLLAVLALAALAPAAGARSLDALIAPESACPGQSDSEAGAAAQEEAMRCMADFARSHAGLRPFAPAPELDRSAEEKSADILRCDSFSHDACGREFTYWMARSGYMRAACFRVGENIAWGTAERGAVRSIFRAWLESPPHRANILGGFDDLGVGLDVGSLAQHSRVHVWTMHFGTHCAQR